MNLIFNPCDQFILSPEGPVSQIHSPHLYVGAPGIFSDVLRSVQMLKREWSTESNGKLPHLFIPSKLQPLFLSLQWKTCPWAEHWWRWSCLTARGEGLFGILELWSGEKPWWNWYLTLVANFGEVWRIQVPKSTLLTSMLGPGSFQSSVQMLKREWGAEINRKLPHLFNPW